MGKAVTTGVDRLVQLVMRKKRITLEDAALELSLPKILVEEWADFLEDKEVIGLEYKLGKTYLVYREMTKQESSERSKNFDSRREGFVRRIDMVLQYLDREKQGIGKLKSEFQELAREVDSKTSSAKKELYLLSVYDEMKKAADSQIGRQEREFSEHRSHVESEIARNRRAINRCLKLIDRKAQELLKEENFARLLMRSEAQLEKRLSAILDRADVYDKKIRHSRELIDQTVSHVGDLRSLISRARDEIGQQRQKLAELAAESKSHEQKVDELKRRLLGRIEAVTKRTERLSSPEIKKTVARFRRLFWKKLAADNLISKIDADMSVLRKELKDLSDEAMIVHVTPKSSKARDYIREFEDKFAVLSGKKEDYGRQVGRLLNIFKKM
ncbi:hypothetical protein HYX10_00080 [Candidatus Woesearchaeota archaeon]|nr:hypothetical protein [Candidatus Woesearchaeota archaeon]